MIDRYVSDISREREGIDAPCAHQLTSKNFLQHGARIATWALRMCLLGVSGCDGALLLSSPHAAADTGRLTEC